jgi:hypothetical protein
MQIKKLFIFLLIVSIFSISLLVFDLTRYPSKQLTGKSLVLLIEKYQIHISPKIKKYVGCKFTPTCSEYAVLAIKKYGAFKGVILAFGRLCRCTPFSSKKGVDYP